MGVTSHDVGTDGFNAAVYGMLTVGTSAVEVKVGGSALSGRALVVMQPKDTGIFYGFSNAVTTSNGIEIFKDQIIPIEANETLSVWVIANGAGKLMRIQELAPS